MSTLKVNKLQKTVSGAATFTLPTDDGTSGQYLKTDGSGALSWGTPPDQKITHASQWVLTSTQSGEKNPITSDLEEQGSPVGFGILGSSMTQASGVFTFPSTGYWSIKFHALYTNSGRIARMNGTIQTTTNDSTYVDAAVAYAFTVSSPAQRTSSCSEYIFDVTDTSTHKVRFSFGAASGTPDLLGASNNSVTGTGWDRSSMTFIRLADT